MEQLIQFAGAIGILTAFVAAQRGVLSTDSVAYLLLNAAGAGLLAVTAVLEQQWGFVFLEGVWTAVALAGLVGRARR